MKTMNQFLFAATLAAAIGLASTASAQFKPTGDDGITASPKVRQQLNERKAAGTVITRVAQPAPATVASFGYRAVGDDGIAASPKVRQMLNERKAAAGATTGSELASVGYRATGADGITASPKLRQQLDERSNSQVIVAPLK